jgi:hypothetical protein
VKFHGHAPRGRLERDDALAGDRGGVDLELERHLEVGGVLHRHRDAGLADEARRGPREPHARDDRGDGGADEARGREDPFGRRGAERAGRTRREEGEEDARGEREPETDAARTHRRAYGATSVPVSTSKELRPSFE